VAHKADELEAFLEDDSAALTPQIHEKLLLSLKDCELEEYGIDSRCEAYKTYRRARNRKTYLKDLAGMSRTLGIKLIGHQSPAVRYQAANLMGSIFGSNPRVQEAILAAARKEQEPAVLARMINVVGSRHRGNQELTRLLLEMADHDDEKVRMAAMTWFTNSFGAGVEGTFDKVLEKVDRDPSIKVRSYLCSRLYGSSDERALAVFNRYLTRKDTPRELYRGCFQGVINAWTGFPQPKKPSKAAYGLTLRVLNARPRSQDRPPWIGIRTLRAAKTEGSSPFHKKWLEAVKPWYKKDRLVKALQSLAADRDSHWMARTGAVDTLRDLGASKQQLQGLKKTYADAKGSDAHVLRAIDRALARM
jgi:hypothetical protein